MNGHQLARRLLDQFEANVRVCCGPADIFDARTMTITLCGATYHGRSTEYLANAAHEVAHAQQASECRWLMLAGKWCLPLRLAQEWDVRRRATRMLEREGFQPESIADMRTVMERQWRGYRRWRVLRWRIAAAAVILAGMILCRLLS